MCLMNHLDHQDMIQKQSYCHRETRTEHCHILHNALFWPHCPRTFRHVSASTLYLMLSPGFADSIIKEDMIHFINYDGTVGRAETIGEFCFHPVTS